MIDTRFSYQENTKKQETLLLLLFLALSFFGLYKNGFSYYFLGKMSLWKALKPIFFLLIGSCFCIFWDSVFSKKIRFTKRNIIFGMITGLMMPARFPMKLFCVLTFFFFLLFSYFKKKFFTFSFLALFKVIVILFTDLFGIGLENAVEKTTPYLYGMIDTFFGRSIGSFGTTSIFLILILFGILSLSFYYKRELPIYTYVSYIILFFLFFFLFPLNYQMKDAMNSSLLFLSVVIVPVNETSPASLRLQKIYGILIGVLSFLFIHIYCIEEGAYVSFLIINILWNIVFYFHKRKFDKLR